LALGGGGPTRRPTALSPRSSAANAADLKAGRWNKAEYSKARGLFGRTLGLVGLGRIGQEVLGRARAFGMPVVAWSPSLTSERAASLGVQPKGSPAEVAAACDVLSIHIALTSGTRHLIDRGVLEALRPGSYFINTARAEVVDQAALDEAVRDRGIRAGLDVLAGEPPGGVGTVAESIFELDGVIGTHHIGASTEQAQEAIAEEAVRIIGEYARTGRVPNVVNLAKRSPATHLLVVHHYDRVGCSRRSSASSSTRALTSRRRRTSSLRGRPPPSPASTWIAPRRSGPWTPCGRNRRPSLS
jgi:D-3-phosphoglycerate dehydrogenase / 2-oxoglutarate reductase